MTRRRLAVLLTGWLALISASAAQASNPSMSMGQMSTVSQGAFRGFYDGHQDTYLSLDASSKSVAKAEHINFAPDLALVPLKTPEIYFVVGTAAPGQIAVLGSEPGEGDYSPVWREVHVSFTPGTKPVLLKS